MSRANAADAMPEVNAIDTASTLHRAMMNCEHKAVSLAKRNNDWPRLHTRPLLGHHEFTASKVLIGTGQQNGELEGENVFTIEILMKTVVVVGPILEQQWRRLDLPGLVTPLKKLFELLRIANIHSHSAVPAI